MAGFRDPSFESVREAFDANFAAGLEAGAACAVVADGRLVVDLAGGVADVQTARTWDRDTLVDCRSATKGRTALCLAMLVDRAWWISTPPSAATGPSCESIPPCAKR